MNAHETWVLPLIDPVRCTGCGDCERFCPTHAVVVRQKLAVIVQPEACTFCEVCEAQCPSGAIGRPFTITFAASAAPPAVKQHR
jgi:MinD superfamily P-loop ATPase